MSSWEARKTIDGAPYYYNTQNKQVTWEKPAVLRTQSEAGPSGSWTWAPHPTEFWVPAKILSEGGDGSAELQTEDGTKISIPKGGKVQDTCTAGRVQIVPLWPMEKSDLKSVEDDLIMLEHVNDGSIIYNLRQSYAKQSLYTWVGASHRVLISINPYQRLPIYGSDQIKVHRDKSPNIDVPPHIFDIANDSYDEMLIDGKHQSILISGESGAGKTEATKQCLKFWASVAGSKNGVEERLIQANPVLEAFGNAKTIRNNNSSRFGKWQEVYFDQIARSIDGAIIINYLLEKSRLIFQQSGERNFHIFYQILQDQATRAEFDLPSADDCRYTCKSITKPINGIDDAQDFKDAKKSMQQLDFSPEEQAWLLRVPAAVLHLGNVTFGAAAGAGNTKGSSVVSDQPLAHAAKLLDVDIEALKKVLVTRSISVNREVHTIALDPEAARAGCDSIAKGVYGRMFDWLVQRCNKALKGDTTGKFVGVLDIFGFEIFDVNSFEQLCINYCNEKLQQLFNIETFKDEEALYTDEGIKFDHIKFIDSEPVLAMIEKGPNGILPALDDECKLPEGDDKKFMTKIEDSFSSHSSFATDKHRKLNNKLAFEIVHYAGTVCYTADEFMLKNRDTFFQDAYSALQTSKSPLTQALFPTLDHRVQVKSLSTTFRSQLAELMVKLNSTSTRYVRCIKPNEGMQPLVFESPLVMRQLRYSGVFEAVAIRKQGYPFRQKFEAFAFRFKAINTEHKYRETGSDARKLCEEILSACPTEFKDLVFGKTMVFYRAPEYKTFKLLRNLALEIIIPRVQGILRGAMARSVRARCTKSENQLNAALDVANDYELLKKAVDDIENTHFGTLGARVFPTVRPRNELKAKKHLADLKLWVDEEASMERIVTLDPNTSYAKYWAARESADKLSHIPKSARQKELYDTIDNAINSCEVGKLDNKLRIARKQMDKGLLQELVQSAAGFNHDSPPVQEAKRVLALPERERLELEILAAQEMNDSARLKACKLRCWEIDFSLLPSSYGRWQSWKGLRSPEEYAKGKMFGKAATAQGMLFADSAVVNQPLSSGLSDPQLKKAVKDMNKAVLAFVGVKSDPRGPDQAGLEALQIATKSNDLKNELFVQLLKAATPHPTKPALQGDVNAKAVNLLLAALHTWTPADEELFKFVFKFVVTKNPVYAKAASHGKFDSTGAPPRLPSDLPRIIAECSRAVAQE